METSEFGSEAKPKMPVQRGARACSTCRAAKMKCVSNEGDTQCQRCKRTNVDCIFEKHRRGRKPGSKLSEASKMLRKLEKGLNTAKSKAAVSLNTSSATDDARYYSRPGDQPPYSAASTHFSASDLPQMSSPTYNGNPPSADPQSMDFDDEDGSDPPGGNFFPAKMIKHERQRNEYFRTVLNDHTASNGSASGAESPGSLNSCSKYLTNMFGPEVDPVSSGLISEDQAKVLFDLFYLRLNPFINLFDPTLHTYTYVRSKSIFLFAVILMASSKFFKIEVFKQCQRMAFELAIRAFAEGTRSVETVQAFACLTYWKDPDDTRTWTWIGYAARMAVELGLNQPQRSVKETDLQHLERRNRERTYLVLFIHDRSLATQTGKNWMLLDDDFILKGMMWHENGRFALRAEDVIVASLVQLRRIAAESTDKFYSSRNSDGVPQLDVNHEAILESTNMKLAKWAETWEKEMQRASAANFHISFLSVFKSYVKLFLNSFGLVGTLVSSSGSEPPNGPALSVCCACAMDVLKLLSKDFASLSVLRYGQDSITVMSAYSAVLLLRLLRHPVTLPRLSPGTPTEIKALIARTADAYHEASQLATPWASGTSTAAYHSRFLRLLLENDSVLSRREKPRLFEVAPPQNGSNREASMPATSPTSSHGRSPVYQTPSNAGSSQGYFAPHPQQQQHSEYHNNMMAVPRNGAMVPTPNYPQVMPIAPPQASEPDMIYWRTTFMELGFHDQPQPYPYVADPNHHPQTQHQIHPQHQSQPPYDRSQAYAQQPEMAQGALGGYQAPVGQVAYGVR